MSRNFGIGSRCMYRAAKMTLDAAANRGDISFATARTLKERFRHFVVFAKDHAVGRMERVSWQLLVRYGQELAWEVEEGLTSASYAQNMVSAVNSVMTLASHGRWQSASPTKDCGIRKRCAVRSAPLPRPDSATLAIQSIRDAGIEHAACIAQLALNLGLRCLEASLLDCNKALNQAVQDGEFMVIRGTKGGKKRGVPCKKADQIEALECAASIQGKNKCLIPSDSNWIQFKRNEILKGREILKASSISGYRELRSLYASIRYEEETGQQAPCNSSSKIDKAMDLKAREKISKELGHERPQILGAYIGGRK